MTNIVKPLDLSTLIRDAILHGRGYEGDKICELTSDDLKVVNSYDPEGLACYQRIEKALSITNKYRAALTVAMHIHEKYALDALDTSLVWRALNRLLNGEEISYDDWRPVSIMYMQIEANKRG